MTFLEVLYRLFDNIDSIRSMRKKFIDWVFYKIYIDQRISRFNFHEREIWWCHLGVNIGFEQDGKGEQYARPVLIFKKFSREVCWAIPLTTKEKNNRFHVKIFTNDNKMRWAIISQLRLIDSKRLMNKICVINKTNYNSITKSVITLCE